TVSGDHCASPNNSPSISPTRTRRLSSRRGSITAPDPWGAHSSINLNPSRSMTSKLTIVRVPPPTEDEGPRRHRRHGSNASLNSNASGKSAEGSRMSFAFTSFSQPSPGGAPAAGGRPASPSSSPRIRPQSPSLSRRYSGSLPSQTKMSPEQLVDLARQSCHPRPAASTANTPITPTAAGPAGPVSFTPLPDSIHVPFLDRPGEVSVLISTPPSAKLFALLAQTFPADTREQSEPAPIESLLSTDPKQWTYADLEHWLKAVDRDVASDVLWVSKARTCVLAHSELIWERIKGALGVPPDLDIDEDEFNVDGDTPSNVAAEPDTEAFSTVFVSDSPPVSAVPNIEEPAGEADELSIEPVWAGCTPPPTADPAHGSSLHEVREEDEEESVESVGTEDPEVHGLRIVTSPSRPSAFAANPGGEPSSYRLPSPSVERRAVLDEADTAYDAMRERGPGHPLFPSSFAHLTLAPTLHANYRSQSVFLPAPSAYAGAYRTATDVGGNVSRGRPEWAQGWDPARHEFAVASSAGSISGRE
ncbi:hypothetical protein B0H21DRAFT_747737, partial [Amylocystis lapponica]